MDGLDRRVTEVIALAVALGVALAPFVFAAVTILRGIVRRRRRLILPLYGIVMGVVFTALVLAVVGGPFEPGHIALVLLAGFWAYVVSAGLHAQGKDARAGGNERG